MTLLSAVFAATLTLFGIEADLVGDAEVILDDHHLYVEDVVDMSTVPLALRSRISGILLFDVSNSKAGQISLSAEALSAIIRKRVPALNVRINGTSVYTLRVKGQNAAVKTTAFCSAMAVSAGTDRIIQSDDVKAVACDKSKIRASIYFDRNSRVLRAGSNLQAGDYLGRVTVPDTGLVDADDALIFTYRKGPVTVQRPVRALQVGRAEHKLFVQTNDGAVLSVKYQNAEKQVAD